MPSTVDVAIPLAHSAPLTGAEMKSLRGTYSLSQSQLARAIGYSSSYISNIERGRQPVSPEVIRRIDVWLRHRVIPRRRAPGRRARPMPRCPNGAGTIYVIEAKAVGLSKVGLTTNLDKRLLALRETIPLPLDLTLAVEVPADVFQVERRIHAELAAKRATGEWFRLNPSDLPLIETLCQK